MCFRGTKQGRLAQQRHEKLVLSLVEKEYKKHCVNQILPDGWTAEEAEVYNKELKKLIEERVRDSLK